MSNKPPSKNYVEALRAFLPQSEDVACRAPVETKDLQEAEDIADQAKMLKEFAREANDRQIEVKAAELQIDAERRLGEMLVKLRRHDKLLALSLRPGNSEPNPIDDRAFDGLLTEVDGKHVLSTPDRAALRHALEKAWTHQQQIDKWRAAPRAKRCFRQLARIHKVADVLLSLLTANNDATELVTQIEPEAALNVLQVSSAVYGIKSVFDDSIKGDVIVKKRVPRIPTAVEWLAGVELPCIYEEFFDPSKRGPGGWRSKNRGLELGPKGLFINAVLSKFGMKYRADSIHKAWTSCTELRNRRRAARRQPIGQK
jgi:hypothetical protein